MCNGSQTGKKCIILGQGSFSGELQLHPFCLPLALLDVVSREMFSSFEVFPQIGEVGEEAKLVAKIITICSYNL